MIATTERIQQHLDAIRAAIADLHQLLAMRRHGAQDEPGDAGGVGRLAARCDACTGRFCAMAGQEEGREHPQAASYQNSYRPAAGQGPKGRDENA